MKHFRRFLSYAVLLFCLLLTTKTAQAQNPAERTNASGDSVRVSLLTCGPRQNVYSLYGHTALRYEDRGRGIDVAVNYGMFSFDKPFFVLRFVFGLTDYEMGIEPFEDFKRHYAPSGCGIWQQQLNLTADEKEALAAAIALNYEPQNRVYRYNYFFDNCTTRARDIIEKNIEGRVGYGETAEGHPSFREMIHSYTAAHPWAAFGNDLLLGVKADLPASYEEQQFLPFNLKKDFSHARIFNTDGSDRPLVTGEGWLLPPEKRAHDEGFPFTPMQCAVAFAVAVAVLTLTEWHTKKNFWAVDAAILTVDALCGVILFAMIFSQHPTVRLNFQIFLLNPLSAVYLWPAVKKLRKGIVSKWIYGWMIFMLLFFLGGIFQTYAEGIYIVALSLLFRYAIKSVQLIRQRNEKMFIDNCHARGTEWH